MVSEMKAAKDRRQIAGDQKEHSRIFDRDEAIFHWGDGIVWHE